MKRALVFITGCLVLIAVVVVISAMRFPARMIPSEMPAAADDVREGFAERLSSAVAFPTISLDDLTQVDWQPFLDFHAFLETSYPRAHQQLQLTKVNEYGLLYHWQGSDSTLEPVLFLAHQDVVPVSPGTEDDWTHDAFSGAIADGYIWGRGTLDDKASLLALLESVEHLLSNGYTPSRSIYLAFGQDEEVGGREGARKIAEHLDSLGLRFAFVLDEGGVITESTIKGVPGLLAVVGVAEKGFVTLKLEVEGEGGHSSMPPPNTAIGILAAGLARLEANPFPARLEHVTRLLREVGPSVPFSQRLVMANQWLTRPLVVSMAGQSNAMNAFIRTTTAVTVAEGGVKANVLPVKASAKVNFRIMPGETVESVEARVKEVLDDPRIQVSRFGHAVNPSPISPADGPAFGLIRDTVLQVAGPDMEVSVAPYLTLGGTDARHYTGLSPNVYRFLFAVMADNDLARIHGTDERLSVSGYRSMIMFYTNLLINLEQLETTP
jgi:carboxypeptidase PM20D1